MFGARTDTPVVGQVAPDDAALAVEDERRRARHVSGDAAVFVPQAEGVDGLEARIGQQRELDPVALGDVAAVLGLVAADREDLGIEGAKVVEA